MNIKNKTNAIKKISDVNGNMSGADEKKKKQKL